MKKEKYIDSVKFIDGFLRRKDWRVKENSNIGFSFSSVFFRAAGEVLTKYLLRKIYTQKISKAHLNGDIHIHNIYMGLAGYCAGWDLKFLLEQGISGVPGALATKPPQHLNTALHHIVNFVGIIQNEWAGAQAFNSLDTLLSPFIRKDNLTYKQVKQAMQEFVFGLNVTARWGGQSPFTNITLDWFVPDDLKNENVIVGGKTLHATYEEYQKEADMINKAFIEVMSEGDANKRPFTFPIPTYNVTKDFWKSENIDALFAMTGKYGLPYFSNFVNTGLKQSDIRSMCCHLRLDMRQLKRNITGGLFGSANSTGSIGVVTINLPKAAYLSRNEDEFLERVERLMIIAKNSLEIKRKVVSKNIGSGFLPYTKKYLGTTENHFSTIGLIGMNEACLNLIGVDIADAEGRKLAEKTLRFMRKVISQFQETTGNLYNLEATPAEGTSYSFAKQDKKKYPKIITAGKKHPFYTNSTQLPVDKTGDVAFAIKHQEDLQNLYTGGTVLHFFLGEAMPGSEACKTFVKKVIENSKLPYITITPTFSVCKEHGYIKGKHFRCRQCGKPCEVYSRVVGYFRPVQNWNEGKQEEFKHRRMFAV